MIGVLPAVGGFCLNRNCGVCSTDNSRRWSLISPEGAPVAGTVCEAELREPREPGETSSLRSRYLLLLRNQSASHSTHIRQQTFSEEGRKRGVGGGEEIK